MIEVSRSGKNVSVTTTKKAPVVDVDTTHPDITKKQTDITVLRQDTVPVIAEHGIGEPGPQGRGRRSRTGQPSRAVAESVTTAARSQWLHQASTSLSCS